MANDTYREYHIDMKRRSNIFPIITCCFVFILAGCATSETADEYYERLSVTDPDLSQIADGSYSGECTLNPPFGVYVAKNHVELEVVIANHLYNNIIIKNESVKDKEHLKIMHDLIIEKQTLQIDALTGATSLTGKAYLIAIKNALE